jgi:hypothetical protein
VSSSSATPNKSTIGTQKKPKKYTPKTPKIDAAEVEGITQQEIKLTK